MRGLVVIALLAALAGLGAGGVGVGAEEKAAPPTPEQMEKMSGKDLYKMTCKTCHGAKSPAGEYTPMTLIQEQWESFFEKQYAKTHQALADTARTEPPAKWLTPEMVRAYRSITPKMLEKIRKFTIDGAADSEHPMTCG